MKPLSRIPPDDEKSSVTPSDMSQIVLTEEGRNGKYAVENG